MKQKNFNYSITILVCIISTAIGISAIWYYTKEDKLTSEAKSFIGKEINIYDLEKTTSQSGQKSIRGNHKLWVIYLLSTCEACNDQLRFVEQLDSNSQVEVVGVMGEEESEIKEFVEKNNIKFPILMDKGRSLAKSLKLKYFPSNFIVNNGKIEKVIFGSPQDKTKLSEFVQ